MNLFTEIRTETRLDVFGVPYQVPVFGKKGRNYSELWDLFKAIQKENSDWKESNGVYQPGQYQPVNKVWFDRENEKQLLINQ
jgi:hypothetical protein